MEMITKILLADSSEEFRLLLRHTLEDTGEFQIVGDTGDGEAAWELIQQTQPDIVVMDVILPGLDGVSLLQRMPLPRKNRQQKRPPPRRMPPRPAPSAVLRSRTMHCSATSAAHSCNAKALKGRCPRRGMPPFLHRNRAKCENSGNN